ncbi:MAG: two-component regulator propeller domain-containing protein [Saprospiraceae bacterium]
MKPIKRMCKNFKYLFWILLLMFFPKLSKVVFAQNYTLSNWTVEDGLSSNDTKDLVQDADGFIWVATEHGLNKFDGYTFQIHRYHPNDSTSIGANFINNICEDGEGNIWSNLAVGIISKYDKLSCKFINYFILEKNTFVYDIRFLEGIGICIASNQGLFIIDEKTQKLNLLTDKEGDHARSVQTVHSFSNQKIYLKTNQGLELFDLSSKELSPIFIINETDTSQFDLPIGLFLQDSEGMFLIQSHGILLRSADGIYFKKIKTSEVKLINDSDAFIFKDEKGVHWFFTKNKLDSTSIFPLPKEEIATAVKDKNGMVWVFSKNNKVLRWNGKIWETILDLKGKIQYWDINDILLDEKNGIWLSTQGRGIWRIYNRKWPINSLENSLTNELIDFEISSLLIENEEFMWVGTFGNVYKYFFKTEELIPVFSKLKDKNPLRKFSVTDISKTGNGKLCLGINSGIVLTDEDGSFFQHIKSGTNGGEVFSINYTRKVWTDQNDKIWIAATNGLFIYDLKTEKLHNLQAKESQLNSLRSNNIHCFSQVDENTFLIGYVREGVDLLTFNPKDFSISCENISYKNKSQQQSDFMTANTFYKSDDGYWVGTFSKGLLKLNLENLIMEPITADFPIIPNVRGIEKGVKGNLWISSIDGIRSVNPEDKSFYRFTKSAGLLGNQFNMNCSVQDHLGNLYFGSPKGLNKIEPSKWNNQDTVATPILTEFKKYDKTITFDSPLDQIDKVELNHKDDFITFKFVSPTYDNPDDVQYAYQLEGFDPKWRYCETQRSATYTNLEAGEYIFKVRAGNKGGFLNSKTKQIHLIVTPPFWKTWWFISLVIALLFFAIWLVYKIQWQLKMNRLKTVAEIRQKAADDFHDELGHRLTKIGLFVESLMLEKNTFPEKSAHILRKIQDNANGLYHSTKDFIWAINPSKDSAMELFILLRDFGDELYEDTSIQFSVEGLKEECKDYMLDMDLKRQLVLIFKEAMNNALKHSNCKKVVFKIVECKKRLIISLKDDGNGFILNHEKFGYGLGSMISRSKKIGGHLDVKTIEGKGTEILFKK